MHQHRFWAEQSNGFSIIDGREAKFFVEVDLIGLNEKFGLSPVYYAETVGLLGPKTVLVHMVWLNQDDINKLATSGTHVSHNPSSNSKLASGVCKVPQM